ncbi:MAG: hypothetical protein U0271_00350 [Polyangiaceae bacterium]
MHAFADSRLLWAGLFIVSGQLACNRPVRAPEPRKLGSASQSLLANPPALVSIHVPERLLGVETGKKDDLGRPIRAACVTCHTARTPARLPTSMSELNEFHVGMKFEHGSLTCESCHLAGAQDSLRRASGTPLPMRDAIELCSQCHGPQRTAYDHGAHGGMNGSWDLQNGQRVRNHCIDCHDPHVPKFQGTQPVLRPHDRGTQALLQDGEGDEVRP